MLSIFGKVHSITATDISEKMIRVAEKNASAYGADVRFLLDDIEEKQLALVKMQQEKDA